MRAYREKSEKSLEEEAEEELQEDREKVKRKGLLSNAEERFKRGLISEGTYNSLKDLYES